MTSPSGDPQRILYGIGLAVSGYACFSIQDAIIKWLVPHYAVFEILFVRSVLIIIIMAVATRGTAMIELVRSRNKPALLARGVLVLLAWSSYYTAARSLGLAELVTLYFAAPLFVVILSTVILKEKVTGARWIAVLVGLAGVILAANPGSGVALVPAMLALFAAFAWGWTNILVRILGRTEKTSTQVMAASIIFAVPCGLTMPWLWITPTPFDALLLAALAVFGGLGQYAVFESLRHAPASAVAPFEYSALVWAFILGFVVFHDIPAPSVFMGAVLIIGSGVGLLVVEARNARRASRAG